VNSMAQLSIQGTTIPITAPRLDATLPSSRLMADRAR
jgi:hypothetical protein